ncbi:MAG TPA: hypothetical protein VFG23_25660 [Polyangia bacterium]|nr:hypothetical protein [Polyangia bacterium]
MFYVKVVTRGATSAIKGSPRQALDYITDGHDARRDGGYSDAELAYIARMGDGWKTDLEGGRVPLVGFGSLGNETDEKKMAEAFEDSCVPNHFRATTGYKSITFTLPKEVSLFAEGHREEAKAAMYAAVQSSLDRAFTDKQYTAVAAIHTRNEAGEIHYHAHVLVGKFAREPETGVVVSLNGKRGGNGPARVRDMKLGWKEGIEKEFKGRLGLGIEQRAANAAPALVMADGTRLEPLNRASRRQLEKDVAPWYAVPDKSGAMAQRQLHLGAMDDRIFELASGGRGKAGWDAAAFRQLFPEHERFVGRYEKRVGTLKAIGYLTPEGRVSPEFRVHFALRRGINTPELQRLRLDLAQQVARQSADTGGAKPSSADPWKELDKYELVRRRVERLGFSPDAVKKIQADAELKKPTPERLRLIRIEANLRALSKPPTSLPQTKTVIRAFVDLQKVRVQRVYLIVKGAATLRLADHKKVADELRKVAERDYCYSKERRLAQFARAMRPMFWAVRVALPRQARRLEKAVERCTRLAYSQEAQRISRDEIKRAYLDWRKQFIDGPRAELKRAAERLDLPDQAQGRERLAAAGEKLVLGDVSAARAMYEKGLDALRTLDRPEASQLGAWQGREQELVRSVFAAAKGTPVEGSSLTREEQKAAVRAGQIGRLLTREQEASAPELPRGTPEPAALERLGRRLEAFGITSPMTSPAFKSLAPAELRKSLAGFREAGVLDDGPGWTLKAAPARSLAQDLGKTAERAMDAERLLTDSLLKRRTGP